MPASVAPTALVLCPIALSPYRPHRPHRPKALRPYGPTALQQIQHHEFGRGDVAVAVAQCHDELGTLPRSHLAIDCSTKH